MSDTPRTDKAELTEPHEVREIGFCVVHADFARQLERENARLTHALKEKIIEADTMRQHHKNAEAALEDEWPPCPHCGSYKDTWFSRTEPMGYYCSDCGKMVD
jgi:hypothetical protein